MVYVDKQNPTNTFFVAPSGRLLVDSKFLNAEQSWRNSDIINSLDNKNVLSNELYPKNYYSIADILLAKITDLDFSSQKLDLSGVVHHNINYITNNAEYVSMSVFDNQKNEKKDNRAVIDAFAYESLNLFKKIDNQGSKNINNNNTIEHDILFENFVKYVQKNVTDLSKNPIPDNLYSLEALLRVDFDIDYQKLLQYSLQKKIKISDSETDNDEQDAHHKTILDLSHQAKIQMFDYGNNGMSQNEMSFSTSTHLDILGHGLGKLGFLTTTHDLSKKFYDFIKKSGRKSYYQEMYTQFHIEDILNAASYLEDTEIYDVLMKTGRISQETYKNLPKVGKGLSPLNAHLNILITPEILVEFLAVQNLLSKKNRERFLNLFKNKPWFKGGGLQALMQIIGGEALEEAEINDFIRWAESNNEQFNQLFSFSDMQEDMSLVRKGEENNIRSKSLTEDEVKIAFMVDIFKGLNTADDPFIEEFFYINLEKESESGFYKGFSYREYLAMRGLRAFDEDISISEEQADMLSVFLMKKATSI